ncbi:MAG: hypothetical protein FJZ16_00555 [Candidatus Omnitrophica bacterium]|nr:hypothetical protein [Candidatus Omnitrophota bacterium]
MNSESTEKKNKLTPALWALKKKIEGLGHPKFPFLSKKYSPNSRVPCVDFTPFIIECLQNNDVESINILMSSIIEANPGLGMGVDWIYKRVSNVVNTPFYEYAKFNQLRGYQELQAMWIIAEKDGGSREFWLTTKFPLFFSQALCCHNIKWEQKMDALLRKASAFIKEMSKEIPYWKDYPLPDDSFFNLQNLNNSNCLSRIASLSIGARLHLFNAISLNAGSLPNLTNFSIRSFGLNSDETTREILESQLLISSSNNLEVVERTLTKDELIFECNKAKVEYKKSWKKSRLLHLLKVKSQASIDVLVELRKIVKINPEFRDDLLRIYEYANALENPFKVLCFI